MEEGAEWRVAFDYTVSPEFLSCLHALRENQGRANIGIIVEADTRGAALAEAARLVERIPARVGEVLEATSLLDDPTREIAWRLWELTAAIYKEDLTHIATILNSGKDPLDNLEFRAACLRLGVMDGFPIFLYGPTGFGVTTEEYLRRLLKGIPGPDGPLYDANKLWLVLVEEQQ